jgi:hypothetical protein
VNGSVKKATGRDGISAKLLKLAKPVIAKPITKMINKTITNSVFPDQLKQAQVVALHKKNNALDKSNYRPVTILPVFSKFFERAIYNNVCGRQSKALDRSISTAAMYLFWSSACFKSSIIFSSVVLQP